MCGGSSRRRAGRRKQERAEVMASEVLLGQGPGFAGTRNTEQPPELSAPRVLLHWLHNLGREAFPPEAGGRDTCGWYLGQGNQHKGIGSLQARPLLAATLRVQMWALAPLTPAPNRLVCRDHSRACMHRGLHTHRGLTGDSVCTETPRAQGTPRARGNPGSGSSTAVVKTQLFLNGHW